MSQAPKDTHSAAQKARDTAGIIGSFKQEGYVPNAEDEAIHQRAERGEITTEEAIASVRESGRRMIIGESPSRMCRLGAGIAIEVALYRQWEEL